MSHRHGKKGEQTAAVRLHPNESCATHPGRSCAAYASEKDPMTDPTPKPEEKCGVTHHGGCPCHEAAHAQRITTLEAQLAEREAEWLEETKARIGAWFDAGQRLAIAEKERDAALAAKAPSKP